MVTHTLLSGELIEYDSSPALDAFLAELAALSERGEEGPFIDVLYSDRNPILRPGSPIPGRGLVTREVLVDPRWHVMGDYLDRLTARRVGGVIAPLGEQHSVSVSEAAAQLGMTPSAVRQAIEAGRLPARKIGGSWAIAPSSLDAYRSLRRGPKSSRAPELQIRLGSTPDANLKVKSDGEWRTEGGGRGSLLEWTRALVRTSWKPTGTLRTFELAPDASVTAQRLHVGELEVRGRFRVVEHANNPKDAERLWKGCALPELREPVLREFDEDTAEASKR
ncbi:MAG TPA: helix-turn-helix domain-containing protein [Phycisphaerales bacterium]|nr:helix-turn-helix domain-containing protein [Phycisphaerales bacterium]